MTNDIRKQEILQRLRKMNCRVTNQRRLLLDIILSGECSCCKEIYYEAIKKDRKIGIATVYRMVNTLEGIGAISWNRLSQIQCDCCEEKERVCRIVLDEQTEIELSETEWKQVVASGLRCCGFLKNQEVKKEMQIKILNKPKCEV